MTSIIIDSREVEYNTGIKLLKLKHRNTCPIEELKDIWDDIPIIGFKELASFNNLEERRIGLQYIPIEDIINQVEPKLIDEEILDKSTTWITEEGKYETKKYKDTYRLYTVSTESLGIQNIRRSSDVNRYYVEFSCTSTGRKYFIWVDPAGVWATNNNESASFYWFRKQGDIKAIQAIAWTITTDIPKDYIQEIIRQGDCIFIKPKGPYEKLLIPRHLTEKEYKEFLTNES